MVPARQSGSPVVFAVNEITLYRRASGHIATGSPYELLGAYFHRLQKDGAIAVVWNATPSVR